MTTPTQGEWVMGGGHGWWPGGTSGGSPSRFRKRPKKWKKNSNFLTHIVYSVYHLACICLLMQYMEVKSKSHINTSNGIILLQNNPENNFNE